MAGDGGIEIVGFFPDLFTGKRVPQLQGVAPPVQGAVQGRQIHTLALAGQDDAVDVVFGVLRQGL